MLIRFSSFDLILMSVLDFRLDPDYSACIDCSLSLGVGGFCIGEKLVLAGVFSADRQTA